MTPIAAPHGKTRWEEGMFSFFFCFLAAQHMGSEGLQPWAHGLHWSLDLVRASKDSWGFSLEARSTWSLSTLWMLGNFERSYTFFQGKVGSCGSHFTRGASSFAWGSEAFFLFVSLPMWCPFFLWESVLPCPNFFFGDRLEQSHECFKSKIDT